ncbi:NAD-P-binding protein [Trametes polyzona]|nr:NAD-P-binding protein [Trametes polyzona]
MPILSEHVRHNLAFVWTVVTQLFPGKPSWTADHLPDLSSKVFIVTGGNAGIGRETIKRLLLKNAKVYIATRSKDRAEHAIAELREQTGREASFLRLDLGDLDSVKAAAEDYKRRESQLDALILNAGVIFPGVDELTKQGYDATTGINVVGHFLLFRLLYPLLAASGRQSDPARVVWLSSMGSYKPYNLTFDAYKDGPTRRRMDSFDLYCETKAAAVLLSMRLARNCKKDNVVSIAVDPGYIKSEIYRSSPWYIHVFDRLFSYPVEYGAIGSLYAGAAPEGASLNGKYIQAWARVVPPNPLTLDEQMQEKLWKWLEEEVQSYLD